MGLLAARRALAEGWQVAALDVNIDGLESLGSSPALLKLTVDVTDFDQVRAAAARAEAELGPIERATHAVGIMPLGLTLGTKGTHTFISNSAAA